MLFLRAAEAAQAAGVSQWTSSSTPSLRQFFSRKVTFIRLSVTNAFADIFISEKFINDTETQKEAISKKKKIPTKTLSHGYIISPETVSKRTGMSETQITNAFSSPKQNPTDCPPNCSTIPKLEKNNNKTSPHFQTKLKLQFIILQ